MNPKVTTALCTVLLASACMKAPDPGATADPTASSGYATATSALTTADDSRALLVDMISAPNGANLASISGAEVSVRTLSTSTNGRPDIELSWEGNTIVFQHQPSGRWSSDGGTIEGYLEADWTSNSDQLRLFQLEFADSTGGGVDSFGLAVDGINASPDDVNARTGTATFDGRGALAFVAEDVSWFEVLDGPVQFTADFAGSTIDGELDLRTSGLNPDSAFSTTVTFDDLAIENNTFSGSAGFVASDFGMSSIDNATVNGAFYETGATGIGGTVSASATLLSNDKPVIITGAFAASELELD